MPEIRDRDELVRILYREAWDKLVIEEDGSWYTATTGTQPNPESDVALVKKRVSNYGYTEETAAVQVDIWECELNDGGCGEFRCEEHREAMKEASEWRA